jgi:hypothetical protein
MLNSLQTDKPISTAEALALAKEKQAHEKSANSSSQSPLSADVLERLEGYSRDELIALIKLVSGAIWGYALDTREQKAEAARLKLYALGMDSNDISKVVPALDKWFDRTMGKAVQPIAQKIEVGMSHDMKLAMQEMEALPTSALLRIREITQGNYTETDDE